MKYALWDTVCALMFKILGSLTLFNFICVIFISIFKNNSKSMETTE